MSRSEGLIKGVQIRRVNLTIALHCVLPQTETKSNTNSNWLSCSRCKFQYCHWCLEPCFGAWHFSDYGCKQFTNMQQDLNHFNKMAREQKHQEQQNQEQQHREQQHEEED